MKKRLSLTALGLLVALLISACQPAQPELPTVAVLPSEQPSETPLPSETPTETATLPPSATSTPSETPTPRPTSTPTDIPSVTPRPSRTPAPTSTPAPFVTETPNPNTVRILTATAAIIEAPTLATLTPIPAGMIVTARPTSTGTPLVTADVIITEQQFQEQLEDLLSGNDAIDSLQVDFQPDEIRVTMTASGGQAFVSGTVIFGVHMLEAQPFNQAVTMTIDDIQMEGGGVVPQAYLDVVANSLYVGLYDTLKTILDKRLQRTDHDLENLTLSDTSMDIFLYVPR